MKKRKMRSHNKILNEDEQTFLKEIQMIKQESKTRSDSFHLKTPK